MGENNKWEDKSDGVEIDDDAIVVWEIVVDEIVDGCIEWEEAADDNEVIFVSSAKEIIVI